MFMFNFLIILFTKENQHMRNQHEIINVVNIKIEIFDMVKPVHEARITLADLVKSGMYVFMHIFIAIIICT